MNLINPPVVLLVLAFFCCPLSAQSLPVPTTEPTSVVADVASQTGQRPISIDLKDASYVEVADALGKATGTTCVVARPAVGEAVQSGAKFELKATAKPFWETFEQLDRQHGMTFVFPGYDPGAVLALVPTTRMSGRNVAFTSPTRHTRAGDFMVFFTVAGRTRPNTPLLLHWSVVCDPRVEMAHVEADAVEAKDEQGNKYSAVGNTRAFGSRTGRQFSLQTQLSEPDKPLGTKLNVKADLSIDVGKHVTIHVECQDIVIRP